jgi:hypothetical protein
MTIKTFLKYLKTSINKVNIGTKVGSFTYMGLNKEQSFASPGGGSWDPKLYPAFHFKKGEREYLVRILPDYEKIVIEALHLRTILINYQIGNDNFVSEDSNIQLLENYVMTVKSRVKKEDVKKALASVGMDSNVILKLNAKNIDLNQFIEKLFKWSHYREQAKEKIRNEKALIKEVANEDIELQGPLSNVNTNEKDIQLKFLNQILFGPPGTGKTYNTINKAIAIANPGFDLTQPREKVKAEFDRLMKEGQIMFTTFHQSMSYEDFVEGIKPIEPVKQGEPVNYKVVEGIFRKICRIAFVPSNATFESSYQALLEEISKSENGVSLAVGDEEAILTTQANGTDLNVSGVETKVKAITKYGLGYVSNSQKYLGSWGKIYKALFNLLAEKYGYRADKKEINKNFVLIIDEINRGNVSQIFGELITLIEEDKRLGNDEALEVTLPYSKEKFGVPPNLYIIGTMNTADRSVEALDTALRRRFSFEEMPPNYDLPELGHEVASDVSASKLLQTINNRIEKLLDKDHLIGHSFFMKVSSAKELMAVFYDKIIPLLQEYFYGDYGKIGLVLGRGFVREKADVKDAKGLFCDFDGYDSSDFSDKKVFEIIDYRPEALAKLNPKPTFNNVDLDFEKAIKLLMGQPWNSIQALKQTADPEGVEGE